MLQSVFTENKMQQQIFLKNAAPSIYGKQTATTAGFRKMLHRLFTGTKLQLQKKNVAPFSYGKQNATTDEKCCTVQLRKPKCNNRQKMLRRPYTENKMQQQLKLLLCLFKGTKLQQQMKKCCTENKIQQQMKNVEP